MISPVSYISRKWVALAGKLLGITVVSGFCLVYLSGKITHTANAIKQARSTLAAFHARYDKLAELKKDWQRVEPHLGRLETAIPTVDNFPVVSGYINSVATKTSNIVSARFDPIPKLNEHNVHELSFSFQINGNVSTIHAFLAELEKAPYFIDVRAISITFPNGLAGQATGDASGVIYLTETTL